MCVLSMFVVDRLLYRILLVMSLVCRNFSVYFFNYFALICMTNGECVALVACSFHYCK